MYKNISSSPILGLLITGMIFSLVSYSLVKAENLKIAEEMNHSNSKEIMALTNSINFAQTAPNNNNVSIVTEEAAVVDAVQKASPAVVSIIASAEVPKLEMCMDGDQSISEYGPFLCERGTETQRIGAGSGFIVSADGYIVTNNHVLDQGADYTVILNDESNLGRKVRASVVARDAENDIAVLKIEMNNLPFLKFGDSSSLQVGQTAIAIGYALGEFDNSVSKGVVSGLARSIEAAGRGREVSSLRGLIQTDAAINPGNSGGPLLNIKGEVIGINVAMATAQSIGFAIPGNIAKNDYEQVKANGSISRKARAFLGVRYLPVTIELQSSNKLPYNYGMLVVGDDVNGVAVVPGSPADKAGIKESDIILEADGKQLNERHLLLDFVSSRNPGDKIQFKIYSGGEEKLVSITLSED